MVHSFYRKIMEIVLLVFNPQLLRQWGVNYKTKQFQLR